MKQVVRVLIILAIIALWLFANNELTETVSVVFAALIIVALAIDLAKTKIMSPAKERHQKSTVLMFFSSSLFVLFAMWARHEVVTEADEFANQLIERYACRPALSKLELSDEGWERKHSFMVAKTFKKAGASRVIHYLDTGLLRYGFLHEEKRSYIFPECKR